MLLLTAGILYSSFDLNSRPSLRTSAVFLAWSTKLLMFSTTSLPTLSTPLLCTVDFCVLSFLRNGIYRHQMLTLTETEMRSPSLPRMESKEMIFRSIYKPPVVTVSSSSRATVKMLRSSSTNFSLTVRWDRLRTYLRSHQLWHPTRRKMAWAHLRWRVS